MQPEPKKPIEELLEASARARRTEFGADPQMPNPMRARLHDEIARMGREETKSQRSWFASFWPQLSLATAVAAAVVVAAVVWLRTETKVPQSDMKLAMQAAPPAPNDASAPLHSLDAVAADELSKKAETKPADSFADAGKIAAAPPASEPGAAEEPGARSSAEVAPAPAARTFAQTRQMETANMRQRFSQNIAAKAAAPNEKLKQRTNLLNTFDVQQDGDRIRIVDEDGSTYTGKLEQIAQSDSRSLSKRKDQKNAAGAVGGMKRGEETESNEYYFRAAGFNSTLKKDVVLEANYIGTPSEEEQPATKERARAQQNQPSQQAPARIVGTAKVAGEPPVQVDAVSVAK